MNVKPTSHIFLFSFDSQSFCMVCLLCHAPVSSFLQEMLTEETTGDEEENNSY